MGLLDDLKRQADQVRTQENLQRTVKDENIRVVESAMARTFQYLMELFKQLGVLKPTNPVAYAIPGVGDLANLQFTDSHVDYRKKKIGDKDYYDRIEFYLKWSLPQNLVVERDMPPAAKKVRDMLWSVNVKFSEEEIKGPQGTVLKTRFTIPSAMVTEAEIRADHNERRILFSGKNLLRLGRDDFVIPADDLNDSSLDEFAKVLIGQPSGFRRFRTVLPR
jgi:hypothetical protein